MRRRRTSSSSSKTEPQLTHGTSVVKSHHIDLEFPKYNLLRPRCVEGRNFNVQLHGNREQYTLTIKEAIVASKGEHCPKYLWKNTEVPLTGIDIHSSELHQGQAHILGAPVVIGCRGNHIVLQYNTSSSGHLQFMYVNLLLYKAVMIKDNVHYFPRDMIMRGNVECHISPDVSVCLFCLPEAVKASKYSKILHATISRQSDGTVKFGSIEDTRLQDRLYMMVSFDPRKPHHAVVVEVDAYCHKYRIQRLTTETMALEPGSTKRLHSLTYLSHKDNEEFPLFPIPTNDVTVILRDLTFTKCGKHIAVGCLLKPTNTNSYQIRVMIFNSDSFELLKNVWYDPNYPFAVDTCTMLIVQADDTDSKICVTMCSKETTLAENATTTKVKIPWDINLKSACLVNIRRYCVPQDIAKLPLPVGLINDLLFKNICKLE